MERNTKVDILAPPKLGVRLLEVFLPPIVVENEIGDLEEEYRAKVKRDDLTRARRWFWIQVFYTLGTSLKEEGARCLLHRGAVQWYRGRDGSLQASFDISQLGRNRIVTLLIIFLILCAMLVWLLGSRAISSKQELAQLPDITSILEARESRQFDRTPDKSSLRQTMPAVGRLQIKVSKKTTQTGMGVITTIASRSVEEQNSLLQASAQNAQANEGGQGKEQHSTTAEDSTNIVRAQTPPRTDMASVPRDVRFIEIKERDYLSAPPVNSKPSLQAASQAVSERGCFW